MSINTRSDLFCLGLTTPSSSSCRSLHHRALQRKSLALQTTMVVAKASAIDQISIPKLHHPATATAHFAGGVPAIDLSSAAAATEIVGACEELGFFKVANHGVPHELLAKLEGEAVKFFSLPRSAKEVAGASSPFGYGCREIGRKGDVGWIEYLLLEASSINPSLSSSLRSVLEEYVPAMKKLACQLLELMAEGLDLRPRNTLSRLLMDDESDLLLRLNHYPPCPSAREFAAGIVGFGEHTDPQIISILQSNSTHGLQIKSRDGRWVAIPPDQSSLFVNVGDSLQVLTNGRFTSVKHRVLTNDLRSRVSMVFFGGPPLMERVAPLRILMEEEEQSLYREFTWREYKATAYKTKLVDDRLRLFETHGVELTVNESRIQCL